MGRHLSERVPDPTVKHLKDAVEKILLSAVKVMEAGTTARAPLIAQYSFSAANSEEEALLRLGVAGKFNYGVLRTAFGFSMDNAEKSATASVLAEYTQTLLTISAHVDGDSVVSNCATEGDVDALGGRFSISKNNPPILIGSVVYGRYALGRFESKSAESSRVLAGTLNGAYAGVAALDVAAMNEWKKTTQSMSRRYVFNGGPVDAGHDFVRSLDVGEVISIPPVESIVPIGFSMSTSIAPWTTLSVETHRKFVVTECLPPGLEPVTRTATFTVGTHTNALDTGIDVQPGDTISVVATGNIYTGWLFIGCNGPDGMGTVSDGYPLPGGRDSALIGHVGNGQWFTIGSGANLTPIIPQGGGTLVLGTNDNVHSNGDECRSAPQAAQNFSVRVSVTRNMPIQCKKPD